MKCLARVALVLSLFASSLSLPVLQVAKAVSTNPTPNCSAGTTCTITFPFSGDYYTWVVPTSATMTIDVQGAQGGTNTESYLPSAGGLGGRVAGTLSIASGTTLYIYPGGQPSASSATGGWNGGASPGISTSSGGATSRAGGGGGASDIRTSTALSSRIVVAGGGGGSGRDYVNGSCQPCGLGGAGGAGGSNTGATGASPASPYQSGSGGAGGTQSAGGQGGSTAISGNTGTLGVGGIGADGQQDTAGGGGGGGYYGGGGGATQNSGHGGGGGGSSYVNASYVTATTNAQGIRSGNGFVTITYENTPTPTTFSTSQTSPANIGLGSTVSYTLALSQSVSDLSAADFKFGGSSSCNSPTLTGSGSSYTVSVTNCSEGTLILQLKANSITGTSSGPSSDSSANTILIDRTLPTISSVLAPANGSYKPGDTPTFTVAFSETVTITGTPRLVLTVGSATRYANYVSMVDSSTARFRYTVGLGTSEVDSDGITLDTNLDLNSGTISDRANNSLVVVTLSPPTLTSVLVVQPPAAPTIDSIAATSTQLSVNFRAGTTYGSSITNYQYSTDNGSTWITRSPIATTSPLVITGLTNNQSYQVRLRAVSSAGNSDSSTAVTGIPTAIVVTGDSTLTTTFGSSASTGTYSATGGTGPYTFSLSSTANSISISGGVVSVASNTPAGSYVRDVIATDSQSKTGQRQITITVNKASSSISVSLQGGGTSTPVGASPVLLITTSQAGSVDFTIGGGGLPACTAIAIAATTGSCTLPAPNSTGSVTLLATFTPTASNNFETSTASITLSIVDGVSTISLSLSGGVTQASKGQTINIIAAIDQAGKVSFFVDGKRIPGCFNRTYSAGNATCAWKPSVQKQVSIRATLNPTNSVYNNSSSTLNVWVKRRAGLR